MRENSNWGYLWGLLTGAFAALSAQDLIYAAGAAITGLLGLLTYLSNNRRNQRMADAADARVALLAQLVNQRPDLAKVLQLNSEDETATAKALDGNE